MFDGLRARVGLAYASFYFRKQKDAATRFASAVSRSRRALVILPERPLDGALSSRLLGYMYERFAPSAVTIVVRDDLKGTLPRQLAEKAQSYRSNDLTAFFTPRSSLIRKFRTSTFDVAFDLNRDFSLPCAFLCRASNAPLRISFVKRHADAFYNLQIRAADSTPAGNAYENLIRCLDMF